MPLTLLEASKHGPVSRYGSKKGKGGKKGGKGGKR